MLVSSARHLPTHAKARPALDALSPGRARFRRELRDRHGQRQRPELKYSTPNPRIRVTMSGIQKRTPMAMSRAGKRDTSRLVTWHDLICRHGDFRDHSVS